MSRIDTHPRFGLWRLGAVLVTLLFAVACQQAEAPDAETPAVAEAEGGAASAGDESQADKGGQANEDRADAVTLAEAWQSPFDEADNVDSVAFWQRTDGDAGVSWILATGKASHDLLVYDADTGELLRRVGTEGDAAQQFRRPNGIMVHGDWAIVVERDNHRVQMLKLPDFAPSVMIGADVLRRPYGLTVVEQVAGSIDLYVTDNYETPDGQIPPPAELGERVKHFRVKLGGELPVGELPSGELLRSFGATEGVGVLTKVETIYADAARDRLLIADEHETGMTLKVYDLVGNFTGVEVGDGLFFHEIEGVALRECGDGGYWIATDQAPDVSLFRVFDRGDYTYRGTFIGKVTANTDGVTETAAATRAFPNGAFFAVHDDQGVTAFDWRRIVEALELSADC
ncbi:MAG: phytase [Acidobacteriota bacterium]